MNESSVAVVGMSCRFPGGIDSGEALWRAFLERREVISEIPASRFDLERFFDPKPATPGRTMTRRGGYLEDIDQFDADFFGISPREAERMDPQQRLLLQIAWESFEDAGIDIQRHRQRRVGVYVGQWLSDFEARLFADPDLVDFFMTTGSGRYASAGRLSYAFGFNGPSLTIDTACSSSLVAVHLALQSLRSGECELALAGGVNVILQPQISIAYSQSRMLAADGRCKFGDASGDGYVRSEGAGLVLLKPLAAALRDGDRIYAVIRGSASNNDGRSSGSMGTPSRIGQAELLRLALADAGVRADEIQYVEAHGTGTRVGDPVEVGALADVIGGGRSASRPLLVGSAKTNLGHTESAAGIAGLLKLLLSVHHGRIPASLHCTVLNPAIASEGAPVRIVTSETAWPDAHPRRGGVSAFGITGTNAHVVVEQAPAAASRSLPIAAARPVVFPLSAQSEPALRVLAARWASVLENDALTLEGVCAAAGLRRASLRCRAAFVVSDLDQLRDRLRAFAEGGKADAKGDAPDVAPGVTFVFPGQGGQWKGMARDLLDTEPVFAEWIERCDSAVRRIAGWSVVRMLRGGGPDVEARIDAIDVVQPLLLSVSIAYARWLQSVGVTGDAVVGHSMGEVGAAFLAGVIDLDQAMALICRRSQLMHERRGQGAMAMVDLPASEAERRLADLGGEVVVAVVNSPRSTVISGDAAAVAEAMESFGKDGIFTRLVKVDVASHSPQMADAARRLESEFTDLRSRDSIVPLYSACLGRLAEGPELDGAFWGKNLRNAVRFSDAVGAVLERGSTVFVEVGPNPVLLPAIEQTARHCKVAVGGLVACGAKGRSSSLAAAEALAALWVKGIQIDWHHHSGPPASFRLPGYPWQNQAHWPDFAGPAGGALQASSRPRPLSKEQASWLHELRWQPRPTASVVAASEHWMLVHDDESAARTLAQALRSAGQRVEVVDQHRFMDGSDLSPPNLIWLAGSGEVRPYLTLEMHRRATKLRATRITWVTRGAHRIVPTDVAVVSQAAAWGALRVLAEEHPDHWGGVLDLPSGPLDDAGADAAIRHLLSRDGEDQAAIRDARRHVPRVLPLREPTQPLPTPSPSDAWLITGGLGEIGSLIARRLVQAGVRHLVLLGRTALPSRATWSEVDPATPVGQRIAGVRALEASGASVQVIAADVGDREELAAALGDYTRMLRPQIVGVVHAAGTLDNQLAADMSRERFDDLLRTKLDGARHLDSLLPHVDRFILFSSTAAYLAQAGQANYAAANAGLDAIADNRRARGLNALSIGWGVWRDTGLVRNEAGARNVEQMEQKGIGSFAAADGVAVFAAVAGESGHRIVLPVDWDLFSSRTRSSGRLFSELAHGAARTDAPAGLIERLQGLRGPQRRAMLKAFVSSAVGQTLKIAPERIDPTRTFGSLGLGSLGSMELRNLLEQALDRPLPATLAWNHPTVDAMVDFLDEGTRPDPVSGPATEAAVEPSAAAYGEVLSLSDEDALAALRGGGGRA